MQQVENSADLGINRSREHRTSKKKRERKRKNRRRKHDAIRWRETKGWGERAAEPLVKNKKRLDDDADVPEKFSRRVHSLRMRFVYEKRACGVYIHSDKTSPVQRRFSRIASDKAVWSCTRLISFHLSDVSQSRENRY